MGSDQSADGLFQIGKGEPAPDPTAGMSANRKFTWRQARALERGLHPLSLLFGHIRVHDQAAPAGDKTADGFRCRTCAFRSRPRGFPKCTLGDGARISSSSNSDCRAWWPACTNYKAAS